MRLPIPFLQKKKQISFYYLALLLTSEKASAVILEESLGKIKIINKQNQFFIQNIEDLSLEELIDAIDKVISRAEEILPPNIEIRKTVFGVKEGWVEEESKKIKKNYLQKLKKICDSLDLSPIGFMVVSEAISALCQKDEGAPLSAIFVELGKKMVTLTLFRGGKSVQTIDGVLEGTYASTVDILLKHFTIEVLPARIILYDTEINEDLIQQFIGHLWSKGLPFLHMPQISVLPSGFDGRAVAFGAATQMGFEVLDDISSEIKTYDHGQEKKLPPINPQSANETKEEIVSETTTSSIAKVEFGFVVGQDISEQAPDTPADASPIEEAEKIIDEPQQKKIRSFPSIRLPKISLPSFNPKRPKVLLIPLAILLLIGGAIGGAYYFYFNKVNASILITLTPKKVNDSRDVIFTVANSQDFSNNVLGAKIVNSTLDGDMTVGATGKKDVGDKAKGSVTIYNNDTDSSTTLFSGTAIKSESGLTFTLDKDVAVASASGDIFSGTKPGTALVDVTAEDIGTNYNLPSGTKFSVTGNSSMAAKNDSAFSGGSKKAVTVASKDDLAKLKIELLKNLEDKAGVELTKQTKQGSIILPIILSTNVEKTKYDKNAGDEAKTIKLTATVNFKGLSYQEAETQKFAKEILQKNYSKEMTIDESKIKTKIVDAEQKNQEEITATLIINASLIPKIDKQGIAGKLSGKSHKDAQAILSTVPQVERTEIRYTPNISFLSKLLPRLPNHVTVNVSSN